MEAPPSTIATTDIRMAILETCTKHMSEGDMLKVAEYLKNHKDANSSEQHFSIEIECYYLDPTDDAESYCFKVDHKLTLGDIEDDEDRTTYISVESHYRTRSENQHQHIQIKDTEIKRFISLLLHEHMFNSVTIKCSPTDWDHKLTMCMSYSDFSKIVPEKDNHYDEFVYYCACKIEKAIQFYCNPDNYHDN
jgi:hypothetical protein